MKNKQLRWFTDESMSKMVGLIDFDVYKCKISIDDERSVSPNDKKLRILRLTVEQAPKRFRIEVKDFKHTFILEATSHDKMKLWFNAVLKNWEHGVATKHENFNQYFFKEDFWTANVIRAEQMTRIADTGDLLFF